MTARGRKLLAVAVVAGLLGVFVAQWRPPPEGVRPKGQLVVYMLAAERMHAGEEIYRHGDVGPFTYPPFAAVPFLPLLALPDALRSAAWFAITAGLILVGFRLLRRTVEPWREAEPAGWVYWTIFFVLVARHVSAVFENKSNDVFIFALVIAAAAFAARGRMRACGAMAGLGAALKATPWLFLPVLLLQRRFRAAGVMVAVAAVAHVLPDILWPRADGASWTVAWYETFLRDLDTGAAAASAGAWNPWSHLNQSLAGTLVRLSQPGPEFSVNPVELTGAPQRALILAAQAAVFGLIGLAARPGLARGLSESDAAFRRFGEAGAVACGMVLLSPMSSKSHFAVLALPIAFCTVALLYRRAGAVVGALLALMFLLGTFTVKGVLGREFGNRVLAYGTVTWCAALALAATVLVLLRTRTPAPLSSA